MRFKNNLSYLELEGQGRGIIMEVTRPLLLRLFYFINRPPWANILSPSVPTLKNPTQDFEKLFFRWVPMNY